MRKRTVDREGKEKSTHPETLARVRRGRARWAGWWKGRFILPSWGGEQEEWPGPVRSDTLPHPLDTPPSDPGPEERVQSQQAAETHSLRAGGGAAPRRAWYGGRAGSRAPDSCRERAEGGRGCRGEGSRGTERAVRGWEEAESSLASCERQPGRRRRPPLGSGAGQGLCVRVPSDPCSISLSFSSPAAKFACFPGACKNSLLRSLASSSSVPAQRLPALGLGSWRE